ncbi:MAG: twin-arginine translocase subunit TatC [Bacteroidetes bacterium]|nr:twin-arginine translocase subunit TatC [Bacteroidota bacterium]MCW5894189.1 twin-arginine translocase subunit TatC [Bacteroidota bacterium]
MTFLDHLEELRWRVIWALAGVVIATIVVWIFIDFIMDKVLLQPVKNLNANLAEGQQPIHLQNLKPFGQLFLYMQVAIAGGVILSIPNILYQIWAFIAPGLMPKERRYIKSIVFFSSFCFLAGIAFAYFIMMPSAMSFFAGFGSAEIENNIAINEYMNFVISIMLAAGVVFELPMVSWFLSQLGILTPAFMRHYRRHAIVGVFVLAAVLTPGTDPVSQILLAVPLIVLYELSIGISALAWRGKRKRAATGE